MAHIGAFLKNIVKVDYDWKSQLIMHWTAIMGNLSDKMSLEAIQASTIIVGVYDSCWLQELYLLSPLLIKTINNHFDKPHISAIKFKKISKPKIQKRLAEQTLSVKQEYVLSSNEQKALETIRDAGLRKALEQFLKRCKT